MLSIRTVVSDLVLLAFGAVPGLAQQEIPDAAAGVLKGRPCSPYADRAFPTNVCFGDTHVHTALSADAGGGGTRHLQKAETRRAAPRRN